MKRIPSPALCFALAALALPASADARNIALLGTADIGNQPFDDLDPENTQPGFSQPHAGVGFAVNDGNPASRVDNWGSGDQFGYVSIVWPEPRTESITSLTLTLATFFDGGWFGVNGVGPGAGGTLTEEDDLIEPAVQVSNDGGETWLTVATTSDYIAALTGHGIGGGANPNPTSATATFTFEVPQTGINGVRIIGEVGGTVDSGFLGVFDLSVEATDDKVNVAPQGTGIVGVNDAVDDDEGTPLEHAGSAANVADGIYATRVDTFGAAAEASFVGVLWGAPRGDAVVSIDLTLATFTDGGWFGLNDVPNPAVAEYALAAEDLVEPEVQATTDSGVTWFTVPHTSNYIANFTDHIIGGGQRNPTARTATFTITTPVAGWNGVRIIGSNGGAADGDGFLGVHELEIYTAPAGDTDSDGMSDDWETANGLIVGTNDSAGDPDADGRTNLEEFTATTNPQKADTDDDGLNDGQEASLGTNPLIADTDEDGLSDGAEVNTHSTNPLLADTDGDGLSDGDEVTVHSTNPLLVDTDGDGFRDNHEIAYASSPTDPDSVPPNEALGGTGIIGVNDIIDSDAGTPLAHAGVAASVNDDDLLTSVDTFGDSEATASFVGIVWPTPRPRTITTLELTLATFFDGGWFGPNLFGPGAEGLLFAPDYLTEPTVQTTTDGETWNDVPHTSDYLTALQDHALPVAFGLPTSATATFTLTPPVTGITGIRIIGDEGGEASNGFLGVFELSALTTDAPPIPEGDADGDGQSNASEAIAGTDPNDPHDYLRVVAVGRTGNQVALTWTSVPGKTYNIESSTDLGPWSVVAPGIPAAAGPAAETQTTVTLVDPVPGRILFRAVVVP